MDTFYLSPNAMPLLAKFLLSLIVTGYILVFVNRSRQVNWFCGYLIGYTTLDFFAFLGQTVYAPWAPLNLPLQYIAAFFMACCYLQFAYVFNGNCFKKEYARVKIALVALAVMGVLYTLGLMVAFGYGPYPTLQVLALYPLLAFCWSGVVFYRKYRISLVQNEDTSREQMGYLFFFVLTVLAVMVSFDVIFEALGLISKTVNGLIFFVMNLLIFTGLTVTFINYLADRTTVLVKLTGLSLVLFLTVIGLQGIVLIPTAKVQELRASELPQRTTFHFTPSGDHAYGFSSDSLIWQQQGAVQDEVLSTGMAGIALKQPASLFGKQYYKITVTTSGTILMGDVKPSPPPETAREPWNCFPGQPAIVASCFDLAAPQAEHVYMSQNKDGIVVTWLYGSRSVSGVQAYVVNNGSIYVSYKNLELSGEGMDVGVAGITDGLGARTSYAGLSMLDFNRNFRRNLHAIVTPLAWFLIVSTSVILVAFPFFYGKSVLQPLKTLLLGVQRVDEGDYATSIPITNYDEIGYVTSHFNSMTESLKKANDELKAYAEELEQRVAKRTKQLDVRNEALAGANKKLEEQTEELARMDRFRTRLFMNISHELRTPITLVSGPLQKLLSRENLSDEMEKQLRISLRNSGRLRQLVEQILDLNRLETGQLMLRVTSVDISEAVQLLSGSFQSLLHHQGVDFKMVIPDHPIEVFLDPDKLEKIITNLLSNAAKFTPEAGTVSISLLEQQDEVVLQVKDTGKGIEPEQLGNIFDRFQTSAHEEVDYREGLGIGLAITKEYVELHGATITVESKPGRGTTFEVCFKKGEGHFDPSQIYSNDKLSMPRNILEQPALDLRDDWSKDLSSKAPEKAHAHILLVEDNRDMRTYIKDMLGAEGYAVNQAENGREALELLNDIDPDLIISDIMMPVMDGMAFLKELKTKEKFKNVPTIFLSARSDMEGRLQGLRLGVNDYLVKPFDATELLCRMANLLEFSKVRKQALIELSDDENPSADQELIDKLTQLIEERIDHTNLTMEELAFEMAMSRRTLYREVKKATGLSAAAFVREVKLLKARQKLENGSVSRIGELSRNVGFSTPSYFSKMYVKRFGKKPADYLV